MRAIFRFRVRIVLVVVVAFATLIVGRLYLVQVAHGARYSQKAKDQFAASGQSGLFDRGSIYFTTKNGTYISAATLAEGYLVAINPRLLQDANGAYAAISAVATTTLSKTTFLADAANQNLVYVEVAHNLSYAAGQVLSAEHITGVEVLPERWRWYPGGSLAAKTIGVVGYGTGSTLIGQSGLEEEYDPVLERSGGDLLGNFFATLFSGAGSTLVSAQDSREGDVVTTIEPEVETRLMDDISAMNAKHSSHSSGGIIMDPNTGAIIAMATYPTYNPNNLSNVNPSLLQNPLVSHVYEFGSIMKAITMTSGLSSGVITATSTYNDTGCFHVDGDRICNWNYHAYGVIPMKVIIMQSLNVGASWIAEQLGHTKMREYFTKLFGSKTGIDLPNEASAILDNLSKPQQIYYDTASFGEGVAVTPIQMIRAEAAIANGGTLVTPHVVSSIVLQSGQTKELQWASGTRVFTKKATQETAAMMNDLYSQVLYNGKYNIPGIPVSMKTGTAQLPTPTGTYYNNRFFDDEVVFFPSYNPRFVILLYTEDPKNAIYGTDTITPPMVDLIHFLINYYNITPSQVGTTTP